MPTRIEDMTGEELLLLRVLGGWVVEPMVESELDRRVLTGPPGRSSRRRGVSRAAAVARRSAPLVA